MKSEFETLGLGYVMRIPGFGVELAVPSIMRRGGDMHAELDVTCAMPGTRSTEGYLHRARFNLSSSSARVSLAKVLANRANLPDLDWFDVLETFCRRVLTAAAGGEPIVTVGDRPQRIAARYQLDPILPSDKTTILYGEGGTGKSTLAVACAVSVQSGLEIVPGWRPTAGNVLYLDWETDPDDVDEKVRAVAAGAGVDEVKLLYRSCAGPFVDMLEETAKTVAENGVRLIVIDSIGMASGSSDGGDAADTALRLFAAFRHLHCSVLAVDHVSKNDLNDPGRTSRPYGSVYKAYLARATFEIRRSDGSDRIALYNTKSNLARKLKPIALSIEYAPGLIRYKPSELDEELAKPLGKADRLALVLRGGALTVAELASEIGVEDNYVRTVLNRQKGRFVKLDDGRWGLASHA